MLHIAQGCCAQRRLSSEMAHRHRGHEAVSHVLEDLQDVAANGSMYARREAALAIDTLQSIREH